MSDPAISRTAPCPCGSGRRYKHCCGAPTAAAVGARTGPAGTAAGGREWPGAAAFARAQWLHQSGQIDEAERIYRQLLADDPDRTALLHYLGVCCHQRGDQVEAERLLLAALERNEHEPMAANNLGLVYRAQGRLDRALAAFDRAIAQDKANALAFNNRGLVRKDLDEPEAAHEDFLAATRLVPQFAEAHTNLAAVLQQLGRHDAARASSEQALALDPGLGTAHAIRGAALVDLGRPDLALPSLERALALEPDTPFLLGNVLHARMFCAEWEGFDAGCRQLADAIDRGERAAMPFEVLALPVSAAQQQRCARTYVGTLKLPAALPPRPRGDRAGRVADAKIRLAYLSADFRNHPLGQLFIGAAERHDHGTFDVTGLYVGPDGRDALRTRFEAAFDRFIDVRERSDTAVAALLHDLDVDILIDLGGHTTHGRPAIGAARAARVQVAYLGFPGTMGAPWIDYVLADPIVIPAAARDDFDEKIACLPHTYMVTDPTIAAAGLVPTRASQELPEKGFVFACFNNGYKITPDVFALWMRLLRRVPGSVLWLAAGNPRFVDNLRREAQARGVAADRLVFAPRVPLAEHLARHRCADLFVDTLAYNAHTTAADALWAGLPLVTCVGATFATRVAASLLAAAGLPELVATDPAGYEALAADLAAQPGRLAELRERLERRRTAVPLFDAAGWVRAVEGLYRRMLARHAAGLPPDHLDAQQPS